MAISDIFPNSRQLIVSIVNPNSIKAEVVLLEKKETLWIEIGPRISSVIGKSGIASGLGIVSPKDHPRKEEGDHKSPTGIFFIGSAFGRAEVPHFSFPYLYVNRNLKAIDDSNSSYYNQIIDIEGENIRKDWISAENMVRDDNLYNWGLVIHHNFPVPDPHAGSCIFIHLWRNSSTGTEGCTAMEESDLLLILNWLNHDSIPLFIQGEKKWINSLIYDN